MDKVHGVDPSVLRALAGCRGQTPRPDACCYNAAAKPRGLTPFANSVSLAAAVPLEGLGRRSRALGLRPMTFDLLPGDWAQERPARPRPHLPGRLLGQLTDPGRPRTSASPHPDPALALGWSVHHARRGIRTAAPGSCAEGRFQDRRRLISEARADNHISQPPSCSVCLHHEPAKLIPAAGTHRWSAAGVVPAAAEVRAQCHPRGCPVGDGWTKCMA